jgi:hypothetical protein
MNGGSIIHIINDIHGHFGSIVEDKFTCDNFFYLFARKVHIYYCISIIRHNIFTCDNFFPIYLLKRFIFLIAYQ